MAYDRLRQATGLEPAYAWVLWEWLSIFAALAAAHFYFSTWFDRGSTVAGSLLIAALIPLTLTNNWPYPDQFLELTLYTLGCACIARQIDWAFLVVLAASAFNRETSVFLVLLFLLSRPFARRHLIWTAAAALLWAAIYVGLRVRLGFVKYDGHPWNLYPNLTSLKLLGAGFDPYKRFFAWFGVVLMAPLAWAAVTSWLRLPRFVRISTAVVAPLFVATCFLFSSIIETRIFTPLLPLCAPAVMFALFAPAAAARGRAA